MIKRIVKTFLVIALLCGLYVAGVLIYGTLTDFDPPNYMKIYRSGEGTTLPDSTFTLVTWNIGYAGQGKNADFFYDGGKQVIPTKEDAEQYLAGITDFFAKNRHVDVFMLQEIDSTANRSHRVNQIEHFAQVLPEYSNAFAINYKVDYVPMPLLNPLGGVISGLATYSRLPADGFERHGFDSQFSWPTRIFFLDRCFLSHRTPLPNGKDLVVINTHCSAYDTSGSMVADEIKRIFDFALEEFEKGNYVVAGGDWNQSPPDYKPIDPDAHYNEHILSNDQLPQGWSWVADLSTPTNRKLDTPYSENSYTSIIDHFAISPNLEVVSVKGIDQNFEFSDHQPVEMTVRIKPHTTDTPE